MYVKRFTVLMNVEITFGHLQSVIQDPDSPDPTDISKKIYCLKAVREHMKLWTLKITNEEIPGELITSKTPTPDTLKRWVENFEIEKVSFGFWLETGSGAALTTWSAHNSISVVS